MNWWQERGFPRRLKLGHRTIRVVVEAPGKSDTEFGSASSISQTITLDGGMSKDKASETLLHEIRHHLWGEWGLKARETEEQVVTILTRAECWAAKQNPAAFRWIYKSLGVLR